MSNIDLNDTSPEEPSADIKSCHTNTSFLVLPFISDTDAEVSLQYCIQHLHQDFLSLGNHLAKEAGGNSVLENCVGGQDLAHNSKEDGVSDRKLKSDNDFVIVSPKKQETWRDHHYKLWIFGKESDRDEEF